MITPKDMGECIRDAREKKNMSQADLASAVQVPQSQISKIERGLISDPSFFTISSIAKALGIPVEDLFEHPSAKVRVKQLFPYRPLLAQNHSEKEMIGLGHLSGVSDSPTVMMNPKDLDRHMYITGMTGTGKSVFLQRLLVDTARAGYPLLFIDPHGASADEVLDALLSHVPQRAEDIVFMEFADHDHSVSFNPMDVSSDSEAREAAALVTESLMEALRIDGPIMPRAVNYANQATLALALANVRIQDPSCKLSILNIQDFFEDAQLRRAIINVCPDATLQNAYNSQNGPYETLNERRQLEHVMPLLKAFMFLEGNKVSRSLITSENKLDIARLLSEGKIIIAKTGFSHERIGSSILGSLLLASAMNPKSLILTPSRQRSGLRVFVDEAHSVLTNSSSVVDSLGLYSRRGIGLISSSQFPAQMDPRVVEKLYANGANAVSFGLDPSVASPAVNHIDAGADLLETRDLARLPNYHAYANVWMTDEKDDSHRSGPFAFKSLYPLEPYRRNKDIAALRQKIISHSDSNFKVARDEGLTGNLLGIRGQSQRLDRIKAALRAAY